MVERKSFIGSMIDDISPSRRRAIQKARFDEDQKILKKAKAYKNLIQSEGWIELKSEIEEKIAQLFKEIALLSPVAEMDFYKRQAVADFYRGRLDGFRDVLHMPDNMIRSANSIEQRKVSDESATES